MKTEYIKQLIEESSWLMGYTMRMQDVTKYTCEEKFNSTNYSRIVQEARKELKIVEESK